MEQKISLLFFSFAIIYIFLGVFIYLKGRFSQINKSFLYLCINTSCWSLGYAFMTTANDIYAVTIIAISVIILSIVFTISKYKMMNITTGYVSDYIFKSVNDPIFYIGGDFLIKKANKAALKTIGYSFKDIENKSLDKFIDTYNFSIETLMQFGKVNNLESNLLKSNGESIECNLSASVINDEFNDMLGIVVILHDISEIKKAEKLLQNYSIELENKIFERTTKLEEANEILKKEIAERVAAEKKILYMGYYDELTGLPNRRCFHEYINKYIHEIGDDIYFAVMFLDLDNFKFVNDTFGHNSGDMLLKHFSGHISKIIREEDMLARIGGDEFLILLANLSKENAMEVIESTSKKIINIFREPFLIENKENYVTTSIGVACYPKDGNDSETIIKNADIAMYEAKRLGKNNVKVCNEELKNKIIEKTKIRNGLYRALELNEMFLYYQPQVNIKSNKIIGFEALLRWKYRHERFISPLEFIPIAEEIGLIIPIGYWTIKTACSELKRYHDLGFQYTMAINLSANQLEEIDFSDNVSKIINEIKVNPSYLEFEITERITFNTSDTLVDNLKKLKILGIKISLDDFGIEYSSYIKIKTLPIDKIKIAKEFIQEINGSEKDNEIVNSIIQLSHDLKLDIIAEGVEEKEQLDFLISKNCNEVQGFFYYKPMPASEIDSIISEIT